MKTNLIQIENTNANDFKNEIIDGVKDLLSGFANTLQSTEREKLLTRTETAEMLSISLSTLWDYTRKDVLPAHKIGSKIRYKKSEVMAALNKKNQFN